MSRLKAHHSSILPGHLTRDCPSSTTVDLAVFYLGHYKKFDQWRNLPSAALAMPGATVKGAQSDPNYVPRLLLDCVPVFHKIGTLTHFAMVSTVDLNWH